MPTWVAIVIGAAFVVLAILVGLGLAAEAARRDREMGLK